MNLKEVEINWLRNILARILEVNNNPQYSAAERKQAIDWLIKQTLKEDRE